MIIGPCYVTVHFRRDIYYLDKCNFISNNKALTGKWIKLVPPKNGHHNLQTASFNGTLDVFHSFSPVYCFFMT